MHESSKRITSYNSNIYSIKTEFFWYTQTTFYYEYIAIGYTSIKWISMHSQLSIDIAFSLLEFGPW
jgi:hypothetical protein